MVAVAAAAAAAAAPHKHALTAITLSTADGVDASVRRCEHGTAQRSALQPPPHMIMLAPAEEAAAAWALRERHAAWICLAALSWTVARMTAATRDTPPTQSASQPHASKSSQRWLGGSIGGALHPHPLYISTSPLYICTGRASRSESTHAAAQLGSGRAASAHFQGHI
eukprot:COSAG01_NODE_1196_length_11303_cov_16.500714_10_plen_168_part_00